MTFIEVIGVTIALTVFIAWAVIEVIRIIIERRK